MTIHVLFFSAPCLVSLKVVVVSISQQTVGQRAGL